MRTTDAAVADLLRRGLAKITPEGSWTQEEYARRKDGTAVKPDSRRAVCWCSSGALGCNDLPNSPAFTAAVLAIEAGLDGEDIVDWNDTPGRTQAEVITAFTTALATVKRRLRDAEAGRGVVEL